MRVFGRKISEGFFSTFDKDFSLRWKTERTHLGFVVRGFVKGRPEKLEVFRMKAPKKILAGGWQSWSTFKVVNTDDYTFKFRDGGYRDTPFPNENHISDYLIASEETVVGFLSSRFAHPYFEIDGDQMVVYLDYFNSEFETEVPIEPLVVLELKNTSLAIEIYSQMVARENFVSLKGKKPTGWSSWYQYFSSLEWPDVLMNLERAEEFPIEVFQIDDSYEVDIGDWFETKAGFPSLEIIAETIRERGLKPGIWLAPFSVSESSKLFKVHPDWVVMENGSPKVAYRNWGKDIYALDLSNDEVLNWLHDLFTNLRKIGFEFFKIDFLFAGAIPGDRKSGRSPIELYREGMKVIRESAKGAFILGCGGPLLPSAGFVDGMRVSEDTAPYWDAENEGISAKYALRNDITRYFFHGRLWYNDPDCLILRKDSRLSKNQREIYALVSGALDGLIFLSDDLRKLSEEDKKLLKKVIDISGGKPRVENVMDGSMKYEITSRGSRSGNVRLVVDLESSEYEFATDSIPEISKNVVLRNDGRKFYFYGEVS